MTAQADDLRIQVARIISGAPFPSGRSVKKADETIQLIRAQVADEIAYERDKQIHQDPDLDPEDKLARWIDDVYQRCIRIARGDQ